MLMLVPHLGHTGLARFARYAKSGMSPALRRRPSTVPGRSRSLSRSVRATAFVEPFGLPPCPFAGPRLFGVLMLVRLCRRYHLLRSKGLLPQAGSRGKPAPVSHWRFGAGGRGIHGIPWSLSICQYAGRSTLIFMPSAQDYFDHSAIHRGCEVSEA
jgi:hypothetical protein